MRELVEYLRGWRFWALLAANAVRLIVRFLLASLPGALVVVCAAYWLLDTFTVTKPMTGAELLAWFDGLSAETKTSIVASLLTVLGFLIAFQTAHAAWRAELRGTMSAEASRLISRHYDELTRLLNQVNYYLRAVADATERIRAGNTDDRTLFDAAYLIEQATEARTRAKQISELVIGSHTLASRFSPLTYNILGLADLMEHANARADAVADAIWWIIPSIDRNSPTLLADFSSFARDPSELRQKAAAMSKATDSISGISGRVRGALMAPIVTENWATIVWLIRHRNEFAEDANDDERKDQAK